LEIENSYSRYDILIYNLFVFAKIVKDTLNKTNEIKLKSKEKKSIYIVTTITMW